jgi:hypothetical protein
VGESLKVEATAARAALDTPTCIVDVKNMYNYTSCKINPQGLEAAYAAYEKDLYSSEKLEAAIQAYLPYHNAALQQASTKSEGI